MVNVPEGLLIVGAWQLLSGNPSNNILCSKFAELCFPFDKYRQIMAQNAVGQALRLGVTGGLAAWEQSAVCVG